MKPRKLESKIRLTQSTPCSLLPGSSPAISPVPTAVALSRTCTTSYCITTPTHSAIISGFTSDCSTLVLGSPTGSLSSTLYTIVYHRKKHSRILSTGWNRLSSPLQTRRLWAMVGVRTVKTCYTPPHHWHRRGKDTIHSPSTSPSNMSRTMLRSLRACLTLTRDSCITWPSSSSKPSNLNCCGL